MSWFSARSTADGLTDSARTYIDGMLNWLLENPWLPAVLVTGFVASMTVTDLYGDILEHGWGYLNLLEGMIYLGFPVVVGSLVYFLINYYDLYRKDVQTQLYNSAYFSSSLDTYLDNRDADELFLLFIDVDDFKQINDELGHIRGDRILEEIAQIIQTSIRWGFDRAFRYGGDEFTVILSRTTADQAKGIAMRIGNRISTELDESVSVSIGLVGAWNDAEPERLVKKADEVMYEAKQQGKSEICQELPHAS